MGLKKIIRELGIAALVILSSYSPVKSLSGKVTNLANEPKAGVEVNYSGTTLYSTKTDENGYFSFDAVSTGSFPSPLADISKDKECEISVYNLKGIKLGDIKAKQNNIGWSGTDNGGSKVPLGTYLIRSKNPKFTKKFTFLGNNEFRYPVSNNPDLSDNHLKKSSSTHSLSVIGDPVFANMGLIIPNIDSFYNVKVDDYIQVKSDIDERTKKIFIPAGKQMRFSLKVSGHIQNDDGFVFLDRYGENPIFSGDSIIVSSSDIRYDTGKNPGDIMDGYRWFEFRYDVLEKEEAINQIKKMLNDEEGPDSLMLSSFNNSPDFKDLCWRLHNIFNSIRETSGNYARMVSEGSFFKFAIVNESEVYRTSPFLNDDGSDFRKLNQGKDLEQVVFDFLEQDTTDKNEYIPSTYVCHHFSADTKTNARKQGIPLYYVGVSPVYDHINELWTGHAINAVLIGDDAFNFDDWLFTEPQGDYKVNLCDWDMPCTSLVKIGSQPCFFGFKDGELVSQSNPFSYFGIEIPTTYDPNFDLRKEIEEKIIPDVHHVID